MSAIEMTQLTKQYGRDTAVDALDLTIAREEIFGFLGPNGAGKSTTINLLLNFATPTAGDATVFGLDVVEETQAVRDRTGVLADGIDLYDRLTGRRHLELAIRWSNGAESVETLLERVEFDEAAAERPVGGYSKGMKQRIALGMALAGDPDLLILDEPSSGLDPNGIRLLRDIVREEARNGTTVFFSSHDLGQVEAVADRIGILDDGKLVAVDTVEGLRRAIGASAELRLHTDTPPETDLGALESVESATYEHGVLRVSCSHPDAKAQAIRQLLDAGHAIHDVDTDSASLEDVFTAYTNGDISPQPEETDRDSPEAMEVVA